MNALSERSSLSKVMRGESGGREKEIDRERGGEREKKGDREGERRREREGERERKGDREGKRRRERERGGEREGGREIIGDREAGKEERFLSPFMSNRTDVPLFSSKPENMTT
jgi:hypothetical protein